MPDGIAYITRREPEAGQVAIDGGGYAGHIDVKVNQATSCILPRVLDYISTDGNKSNVNATGGKTPS
jgi:hypothetical protein